MFTPLQQMMKSALSRHTAFWMGLSTAWSDHSEGWYLTSQKEAYYERLNGTTTSISACLSYRGKKKKQTDHLNLSYSVTFQHT